jgi:CheY-like chemotaxis protein
MKANIRFIEDNANASYKIQEALKVTNTSPTICLVEDNPSNAKGVREGLLDEGCDVLSTDDFRTMADWISDTPNCIDVIIMDLMVPSESLHSLETCKDYNDEIDHSSTLYFIEHFILPLYPQYAERIIILSAYLNDLRSKGHGKQLSRFITVNKQEPDVINTLRSKINAIKKNGIE